MILRVLNVLFNNSVGGPGIRALLVASDLRRHGIETVLVVPNEVGTFCEIASSQGFGVYKVDYSRPAFLSNLGSLICNIRWLLRFWFETAQLYSLIQRENVDIVHINGLLNLQPLVAAFLARKLIVWHLISCMYPRILVRLLSFLVYPVADQKVLVSETLAPYYFLDKARSDVIVIHEPVDSERFNPNCVILKSVSAVLSSLGLRKEQGCPLIGCVADLSPVKGIEYLIEAAALLKKTLRNFKVIIVGAPVPRYELYASMLFDRVRKLGLQKFIIFAGRRQDIPLLLSIFNIFVLPSVAEGTPLVILEASAMEKPIIATRVGGIPDQIVSEDSGILVSPRDPLALAQAITWVVEHPTESKDMAKKARERVTRLFSRKSCADRHELLYRSLQSKYKT